MEREFVGQANRYLEGLYREISFPEERVYARKIRKIVLEAQEKEPAEWDDFLKGEIKKLGEVGFKNFSEEAREKLLSKRLKLGVADVSLRVCHDKRLSERTRQIRLAILEKLANHLNDLELKEIVSYLNLVFQEEKKDPQEDRVAENKLIRKGLAIGKFVLGATFGFWGADVAEKYTSFLPALQQALGMTIVGGLFLRRAVNFFRATEGKIDRFLNEIEPVLLGIGAGLVGHSFIDKVSGQSSQLNYSLEGKKFVPDPLDGLPKPTLQSPSNQGAEIISNEVSRHLCSKVGKVVEYVVTGREKGGLTDILAAHHLDPYGKAMTKFILCNEAALSDPSRPGYEATRPLLEYLKAYPDYTWRDAMNESARQGRATEISELFTKALRFIRPGTVFKIVIGE